MIVNMTKPWADSIYAAAAGLWLQGEQDLMETQKKLEGGRVWLGHLAHQMFH